ncbi:hypothetical protein D3C87_2027480 [compost metagenome]
MAQITLITVATPLMASPCMGASGSCGAMAPSTASRAIRIAATMIITPTMTAEKYSAL